MTGAANAQPRQISSKPDAARGEPLIAVREVSRWYGDHLALDGISFSLAPGDILGFLGPNGAGKSTTMRILTGNLAPSAGSVRIAGEDLVDRPREAKRHLGYLPEHPPLYRDFTVDEYLRFAARLHGV
ncbi:MAG: ATP-binding cassette domain-containing protein, partial [Gammaproteobacteria bacterium]